MVEIVPVRGALLNETLCETVETSVDDSVVLVDSVPVDDSVVLVDSVPVVGGNGPESAVENPPCVPPLVSVEEMGVKTPVEKAVSLLGSPVDGIVLVDGPEITPPVMKPLEPNENPDPPVEKIAVRLFEGSPVDSDDGEEVVSDEVDDGEEAVGVEDGDVSVGVVMGPPVRNELPPSV